MIEVEDKYRVHPDFELPMLCGDDGPVAAVSAPRELALTATYYDTADLRLAREGISLRHRTGEGRPGWQLKLPVVAQRAGTREEIHVNGAAGTVPKRLRGAVTAYTRGEALQAQATLRTARTSLDLLAEDGTVLAEVMDDRVDALRLDRHAATFREIEVEDRGGGSDILDRVGDVLRRAGAVAGEFQPKVVRALGAQATAPPEPPPPVRPGLADPTRALIAAVLRRNVRLLMRHDAGVRLGEDDAVHQMRVNARRLRSALRDFDGLLDDVWGRHLQDELRWLGECLSGGRDNEVVAARIKADLERLPKDAVLGDAEQRLFAALEADAEASARPIRNALASDRYLTLLTDLVDAAAHPRTTDDADRPCADVLPDVIRRSWRRLAKRAARAQEDDPAALHQVRIAAKRTRYLMAGLDGVYGKPARRLERQAEQVQDVLGEHQDAVNASEAMRQAARASRAVRTAFTYGALYALEQQAIERARADFHDLWPRVTRPRPRRWSGA